MPKFTPYPADVAGGWEDEEPELSNPFDGYPPDFDWVEDEIDPNDYCDFCGRDLYDASDFGCERCDYRIAHVAGMSQEEASAYLEQFVMKGEEDLP